MFQFEYVIQQAQLNQVGRFYVLGDQHWDLLIVYHDEIAKYIWNNQQGKLGLQKHQQNQILIRT